MKDDIRYLIQDIKEVSGQDGFKLAVFIGLTLAYAFYLVVTKIKVL